MDHDDAIGGPRLDRQPVRERLDARGRPLVPARVAETRPTPLQELFIPLSVVVLVCGIVAISALEFGARLADPVVRIPVVVGGIVLAIVTVDATVRIWRSAWAWLPVDRGRGLFRFVWVATLVGSLVALAAVLALVVSAR